MPLDLYRRHVKSCEHKGKGRNFSRCQCPVWVDGTHPVDRSRVQRSVGTRDWGRAMRILEEWEADQSKGDISKAHAPALPDAIKQYLRDCNARKLSPDTIDNYTRSLGHFQRLVKVVDISAINVDVVRGFRNTRAEAPGRKSEFTSARTLRKEIEHVRHFLSFCVDSEWIPTNAARKVKPPKDESMPTLPFTPDEVKALLSAVDQIDNRNKTHIERARARARALLLVLLYSGMRISDTILLKRSRVGPDGKLLLRMEKTREPLYVRLPAVVLEALAAVPVEGEYFFWSGKAKLSTGVGTARRTVDCLARMTGINAHPHRFRDTFAVELLNTGADLRTVQKLLGHTSIKTTEKHYAPWVRSFQVMLDTATDKLKFA